MVIDMGNKNYFTVNIEYEKNKYRIFKELQSKQAVIVSDISKKEWWPSVSRNIGRENKNIVLDGEKIIHGPTTNRYSDEGYIIRKHNVKLEEIKKGMISKFIPKRINEK